MQTQVRTCFADKAAQAVGVGAAVHSRRAGLRSQAYRSVCIESQGCCCSSALPADMAAQALMAVAPVGVTHYRLERLQLA